MDLYFPEKLILFTFTSSAKRSSLKEDGKMWWVAGSYHKGPSNQTKQQAEVSKVAKD
jgi:hypothetical protein